ncbi:MAG TPA: hypothetical protein VH253_09255 [Phycisphaerae bacterium]|nr:hypothetical protein [Phycisphaerae bacterium]
MSQPAWRHWYHCTVGTCGTWLPGDPRGWRERDHREHVDGDYKRPPQPSQFNEARHRYAKRLLRFEPYLIASNDRAKIGQLLLENFDHNAIPVLALAVATKNFHAFVQVCDGRVKRILGLAKRHVTFSFGAITDDGHRRTRLWERDGGVKPIADRAHAICAFHYILDHVKDGAWVWSFRDALPTSAPISPPSQTAGFGRGDFF